MTMTITNPALYVLVFGPLERGAGDAARGLAKTWATASMLGITEPVGAGRPVQLPAEFPMDDTWLHVIAAKASPDGRDTAIAFTAHDVAAVAVRLKPVATADGDGDAWIELSRRWRDAAGRERLSDVFGAAHVFFGATDQHASRLPAVAADTAHKVLAAHAHAGLELSALVEPGIAVWDMEMRDGRCVVALTDSDAASAVEEWCWVNEANDDIGPMLRYFMHASKLRFEVGVFQTGIADVRRQEDAIDTQLAELFALHKRFEVTGASADELISAQSRLGRAQGDSAGLLMTITNMRDLRQTAEIAAHNLRAYAPTQIEVAGSGISPFARDLELAEWVGQRVQHEIVYLESRRERVAEAQKVTELRLQQLAAAHARTANWLTVLQTSLVAASLGTLSVATALGAEVDAPGTVLAAVMVLVASATLFLPLLALRWTNGFRWPEITALAIMGGAAGWLVAVAISHTTHLVIAFAAAALGAAALGGAGVLVNGRRRPGQSRGQPIAGSAPLGGNKRALRRRGG